MGYINLGGYKVISFDKIPSTQIYALDCVASGNASDKMAIVAMAQSAGRGRYRRRWVSHHGNLYVSFIFKCDRPDPRLAYVVAVSIVDTLKSYGVNSQIKWPNDILINDAKVSGTLIEYSGSFVIVGIGINVKTNPTVSEYKTTKLINYNADITITELLGRLMHNLDVWRHSNFSDVRRHWLNNAVLNKNVCYHGLCTKIAGISENGALILNDGDKNVPAWGDEITIIK